MRGKRADMAGRRREVEAAEGELTALRRKNVDLLAQVRDLTDSRAGERDSHAREVRALRAEIAAGTSDRVAALTRGLEEQRTRNQRLAAKVGHIQRSWDNACLRLTAWLKTEHGMTGTEAMEMLLALMGDRPGGSEDLSVDEAAGMVTVVEHHSPGIPRDDTEGTRRLQRARRERRR